ncbi:DUF5305 domain-containing protein [Haloarcula laminariae]|uniref:DUF5305 domain-containing protein n=1 Tax=Haloarcula laminariae TaxID=2961577 RepID=UPI002405591B|nr:DUF5305 domain-containing protein [Halomicroarcula sp. FL173]
MNGRTRRLQIAIADNYALAVGILVVLAVSGGYLTYVTHADPGTVTETRERSEWQSTGQFSHQATVVNGTTALPEGAVLRNRTTYFRSITPELNGSFSYGYTASGGGNVSAETTVSLLLRSAESAENDDGNVYWAVERRLGNRTASLAPGEETAVPFSVNVSAATGEAERIDAEFGGTPGELQTVVVARTELSGTRNGRPVDVTRSYRLGIQPDGSVYRVDDPGPVTESDNRSERVTATAEYGWPRTVGVPLLALLCGGGAVGLVVARRRGQLSIDDHERELVAYRADREEFDDWITTGRVPEPSEAPSTVDVHSLEGLVDIAIDTENRVIEDTTRDIYLVLAGDRWYRYDPPRGTSRTRTGDSSETGDD